MNWFIYPLAVMFASSLYVLARLTHPVAIRVRKAFQWKRLRRECRRGRKLRVVPAWNRGWK